jgi:hypothetical protein
MTKCEINIFYLDYQTCVRAASLVNNFEKNIICPDYRYVFHAELEINLNCNFNNISERWILCFTEISLPPGWNYDPNIKDSKSAQVFTFPPDILIIYHNAKIKYRCLTCRNEWTSARGRMIFQAEIPRRNKLNILFVKLCTQQCRFCRREIQPSWYLNEGTRVMKNVCRILIERFYSDRAFALPRPPSSSSEEENEQRMSRTTGHHHHNLCRACQQGWCFGSHRRYQRRY